MKTIGILGGMGPVATAEFYKRIILYCQKKYKAVQDKDYPPIVMYSLPLQESNETGFANEELIFKEFIQETIKLETHGADFIVIPCNTLHQFTKELRKNTGIPVISIIEETTKEVSSEKMKKVGLLASESTHEHKIFEAALNPFKINVISPKKSEQKLVTKVILNVMGGNHSQQDKKVLLKLIENMKVKGAEAIILGCTELPVCINQNDTKIKIFDTLEILAERAVEKSRNT